MYTRTCTLIGLLALTTCFAAPIVDEVKTMFEQFKLDYSKTYATPVEEAHRMAIFADHVRRINEHNVKYAAGQSTFEVGVNAFCDLTTEEFLGFYTGAKRSAQPSPNATRFLAPSNLGALPDDVDWRTKGYVTAVKDQAQCGSCWAFSATGSLEGQHFKKTNTLVSLSEQNLVDCSTAQGNQGCNGGWMDQAFDYIKANKGIDKEASYPYEARDGKCRYNAANVGATCTGYTDIGQYNEAELQTAVATVGPISVAIDASNWSFQVYKQGIYSESGCNQDNLDHGVLAAGYGKTSTGELYWLVKNSWGLTWGNKGYMQMARNKGNMCGIASAASYPLV